MSSLHSIPEPSVAYRPVEDDPSPSSRPITTSGPLDEADNHKTPAQSAEFEEQVGGATWLIVLILCGVALRLILLYLGPFQTSGGELDSLAEAWRAVISDPSQPSVAAPAYALLGWSVLSVGLPVWSLILIQVVLGVIAIPATYFLGHALTGRRLAGLFAATLIALHPGLLTQTIAYHPAAMAGALVAIGLAILCHERTRAPSTAWLGAALLGLAGLMAPIALAAGVGATIWVVLQQPTRKGVTSVLLIIVLGLLPPLTWGWASDTSLGQFSESSPTSTQPVWAELTTPSMGTLGTQLQVDLQHQGPLMRVAQQTPNTDGASDNLAAYLGDGWLILNALLWAASTASFALLLYRRRFASALAIAAAALVIVFTGLPADEAGRIPLIALWAVTAAGLFSNTPPPRYTAEECEQMRLERDEKRNAKLEERLERGKAKSDIYSFDRPGRRKADAEVKPGNPETPTQPMRPI